MSGGDLDYSYFRVDESARVIREKYLDRFDEDRKIKILAFCDHLEMVAKALHDVEWVLGGDYGPDGADKAIDAVLGR